MDLPVSVQVASGAVQRPTRGRRVLLGIPGNSTPALADFTSFNTTITPRNIDVMLFFQSLDSEPPFYNSGSTNYPAWASQLGAIIMSTMSPSSHTLGFYAGGTVDTTGLYGGGGLAGLAQIAASLGEPMIIRLAHEFTQPAGVYGYTKETAAQFVAGWQHIVNIFRANGATNVKWCWSPNIWSDATGNNSNVEDPTAVDGSGVNWYPGDSYVDMIGLDGYNFTTSTFVLSPQRLFMANYNALCALAPTKPFAIAEVGQTTESRLSVGFGSRANWFTLLAEMVANDMPRCVIMNYWQRNQPPEDFTVSSSGADTAAATAFVAAMSAAPFAGSAHSPAIEWFRSVFGS